LLGCCRHVGDAFFSATFWLCTHRLARTCLMRGFNSFSPVNLKWFLSGRSCIPTLSRFGDAGREGFRTGYPNGHFFESPIKTMVSGCGLLTFRIHGGRLWIRALLFRKHVPQTSCDQGTDHHDALQKKRLCHITKRLPKTQPQAIEPSFMTLYAAGLGSAKASHLEDSGPSTSQRIADHCRPR